MSIKAYEAYRFVGKSNELIPSLLAWKLRLYRRMRYCFETLLPEHDRMGYFDKVVQKAREQSIVYTRDKFDYEAGFKMFQPSRGYTILIPLYESMNEVVSKSFQFIAKEPLLKEFRYWDNTDGPEDMPDKEWQLRRKVYGKVDQPVYVSFMNYSSLFLTAPCLSDKEKFSLGKIDAIY